MGMPAGILRETGMKLHQKIKKIRKDLGLSLQDVYTRGVAVFGGKQALSYKTLQRIEKGQIAKFSSVLKICYALGVPLEEMIRGTELEQRLVIRKKERLDEYTYNEKVRASVVSGPNRSFLALELILEPSGTTAVEQSPTDGKYEKWIYVVEGELTCVLDGERFTLLSKDTISFDSATPHSFENRGKKKCICTVVINPKHF